MVALTIRHMWNPFQRYYEPYPFRRNPNRNLTPIPGGRWKIRKLVEPQAHGQWYAWSNGKARPYSRAFATQTEASAWAHAIAQTFKVGDPDTRAALRQELNDRRKNAQDQ